MDSLLLTVDNIPNLLQTVDPSEEPNDIEEVLFLGLYHQLVKQDTKTALQYYQAVYNNHPYDIRSYILVYAAKEYLDLPLSSPEGLMRKLRGSELYDFSKCVTYFQSLNLPRNSHYWYILASVYKVYACYNKLQKKSSYLELAHTGLGHIKTALRLGGWGMDCTTDLSLLCPFLYTQGTLYEICRDCNQSKKSFEQALVHCTRAKVFYCLGMLIAKEYKNYTQALKIFHTGLHHNPEFYIFHLAIGNLYHTNLKNVDMALKHYNLCQQSDAECPEVHYSLGILHEDHFKDYEAAKSHYLKSISCVESQYALGLLSQKIGEYENAEKYFSMMLKHSTSINVLKKANYNMALLYEENFKDFEKARIHYENCLEYVSNDKNIRYSLGLLYQNCLHNPEKALYHYQKIEKNNPKANYAMGVLYQNYFKDYDQAKIHYLKAIDSKANYADVYYALGYLEQDIYNNPGAAILNYQKAIESDKNYHEAHYAMGLIYQDLDQYDLAQVSYENVLKIKINHVSAQLALGLLLSDNLGCHDEARAHYERGIVIVKHADLHYAYGLLLQNHYSEYVPAQEQFQNCLDLDPVHIDSLYAMGLLLKTQFYDYEGARACYERTIEIDFKYVRAHQALGILLKNHFGDFEGARQCYETALSIDPHRSNVHYALGILLYVHYKNYELALHHFAYALKVEPSDSSCFRYIERIMYRSEFKDNDKWQAWRIAMKHTQSIEEFNTNYLALDADELHYTWHHTPVCLQRRAHHLYPEEVVLVEQKITNRLPVIQQLLSGMLITDLKSIVVETLLGEKNC